MISHLFVLNTSSLRKDDGRVLSLLTKERRERVLSLIPTEKKQECIGAELLLMHVFRGKYRPPMPLSYTEKGKPYIDGESVKFSLSHSAPFCVCAAAECDIGVDIERLRDLKGSLERRFMTDRDVLDTPCHVWSAKESFLKLTGDGIDGTIPLDGIETKEGRVRYGDRSAYLYQQKYGEFVISVCTFSPTEIEIHEVSAEGIIQGLR